MLNEKQLKFLNMLKNVVILPPVLKRPNSADHIALDIDAVMSDSDEFFLESIREWLWNQSGTGRAI